MNTLTDVDHLETGDQGSGDGDRKTFTFRTEKVFVGNLPPTVTRTRMRKHFSKYGKITDCVIMVNKDGSGRGFGFCEFEDPESVDRVIEAWNDHYINGQWVEVKRASPENALRKYIKGRRPGVGSHPPFNTSTVSPLI